MHYTKNILSIQNGQWCSGDCWEWDLSFFDGVSFACFPGYLAGRCWVLCVMLSAVLENCLSEKKKLYRKQWIYSLDSRAVYFLLVPSPCWLGTHELSTDTLHGSALLKWRVGHMKGKWEILRDAEILVSISLVWSPLIQGKSGQCLWSEWTCGERLNVWQSFCFLKVFLWGVGNGGVVFF